MSNQQDLREDDVVEVLNVANDWQEELVGKRGTVFAVAGSRVYVEFGDDVSQNNKRAVIHLDNLRKLEEKQ